MLELLAMPFEIAQVFGAIRDVYDAFPFAIKAVILACFGVATMFSILKMLL